jgi:glutathione S-transferase/RNA polymerase-associated protein
MSVTHELIVYEHPLSPYAQKVKLALLEKDVPFSTRHMADMSESDRETFLRLSPRGEVPLLVDDGLPIFDSTIMLEYIESKWPQPALLPYTPQDQAKARQIEEVMDTHFEANTWGLSEVKHFRRAEGELAQQLTQFGSNEIRQWLQWLEGQLDEAPWFNGAHFGWADICVVPFVNGATRFEIFPQAGSAVAAWLERANARPSVTSCREQAMANELDADVMTAALAQGFKREYRDHRLEWMIRAGGLSIVEAGLAADNLRFIEPFPPR